MHATRLARLIAKSVVKAYDLIFVPTNPLSQRAKELRSKNNDNNVNSTERVHCHVPVPTISV